MNLLEHIELFEDRIEFLNKKYANSISTMSGAWGWKPEYIIQKLSELDPSRNNAYTEWLIQLHITNRLKQDDWYKVTEYLTVYDSIKQQLPVQQRQINQIKSLPDLFDIIEPYTAKVMQEKNENLDAEMRKEVDILMEDDYVLVLIPKTLKASCYFGSGTEWCTADKREEWNRFKHYNELGALYIIIFKTEDAKYQFHFQDQEYMDEDDRIVDPLEIVEYYPPLIPLFRKIFLNQGYYKGLRHITEEEAVLTFESFGTKGPNNRESLVRDYDIMPDLDSIGYQLYLALPDDVKDRDIVKGAMLKYDGLLISMLAIKERTQEFAMIAVKQNGAALKYIRPQYITKELLIIAVSSNPASIKYMGDMVTEQIAELAVSFNGRVLRWVPAEMKTKRVSMTAVKNNGLALGHVPIELRRFSICLAAVKENQHALMYVPLEVKERVADEIFGYGWWSP